MIVGPKKPPNDAKVSIHAIAGAAVVPAKSSATSAKYGPRIAKIPSAATVKATIVSTGELITLHTPSPAAARKAGKAV
jgi:hypothetical protein